MLLTLLEEAGWVLSTFLACTSYGSDCGMGNTRAPCMGRDAPSPSLVQFCFLHTPPNPTQPAGASSLRFNLLLRALWLWLILMHTRWFPRCREMDICGCAECPHSFIPSTRRCLWSRRIPQLCTELMLSRGVRLVRFLPFPAAGGITAPSSRCGAQGCSLGEGPAKSH